MRRALPFALLTALALGPGIRANDLGPFLEPDRIESASPSWRQLGAAETETEVGSPVPSDAYLIAQGAVIGEILIETRQIFDTSQPNMDRWAFRTANKLHINTRDLVVREKLLFDSGDRYDPRLLEESERYLRSLDFLGDAWIQPIAYRDGQVDLLIVTRDVWTLAAGAGFERKGGENALQIHLREGNLFGTGRFVDLKYSDDADRSSYRVRYVDQSLFGPHAQLRLWWAENSDGYRRIVDLDRPFVGLDSRWSAAVKLIDDLRYERRYRDGKRTHAFEHRTEFIELRGALSEGFDRDRNQARRWGIGLTYDDHIYARDERVYDLKPDPPDRTHVYPWVSFELVENGFVEERNLDQLRRVEDLNLGTEVYAQIGWSDESFGASKSQLISRLAASRGFRFGEKSTLLLGTEGRARWATDGEVEDGLVQASARFYRTNFDRHRFVAFLRFDAAWNLDIEHQLRLGGENGLRGYDARYTDGDRRVLLSLEQRLYTNWEIFNLVNVGGAVFVDVGKAWYAHHPDLVAPWLADVGFGLRLSSNRSSEGKMLHLDVAYPLRGDSREIQWLVTTRSAF